MAPPSSRMNEYFVPRNGIDREVITADICRYLGNDALVRPGNYENPQTHQIEQGYYITAYRNLTSAMIADLKADSERWEAERRQTAQSRGTAPNVEYRSSTTHHTRQYYGPTEAAAAQGYAPQPGNGQAMYDSSQYQQPPQQQYQQPSGYGQPVAYPPPQGYPIQDNYYIAGADMSVAAERRPPPPGGAGSGPVPRSANQYPSSSQATYQGDSRSGYYASSQPSLVSSGQYSQAPSQETFYPRADPSGAADYNSPEPMYDVRPTYQESPSGYAQVSVSSNTPPLPATAGAPPRYRSERDERERRDRHRR